MKILHLCTNPAGGAALSCLRLHRALLKAGTDSEVLFLRGEENPAGKIFVFQDSIEKKELATRQKQEKRKRYRQSWQVRLHAKPVELFSFPDSPWKIEEHPLVAQADIIHLHWVAGMIDVKRFFGAIKKPVVWTLHDAWPFTGGFHYQDYFSVKPFESLLKINESIVRNAYAGKTISVVSPSAYLKNAGEKSGAFGKISIPVIRYGVPADIYFPVADRRSLRKKILRDDTKQTWFFACDQLDYYRKGADLLLDTFHQWENKNVQLVIAGEKGKLKIPHDARIEYTGHIGDPRKMAEWLNAADALIHPSREDNLPNLVIESLMCGTPVLAVASGGIPEMITDDENGWLVHSADKDALRGGFERLPEKNLDRDLIAEKAAAVYSSSRQAEQYVALYRSLC